MQCSMRNQRYSLSLLLCLFVMVSIPSFGQGYRIEVSINGLSGDTLILGEYFTTRMIPMDTIILDAEGNGTFEGERAFEGGLYLIYLNPDQYFDFLLGDDQELSITATAAAMATTARFEGSEDNRIFTEYKNFLQSKREELNQQQELLASAASAADSTRIRDRQKAINKEMESYMDRIEADHSSLFVSDFIGATREPFPPEAMLTGDRRHDDSLRFFYYKNHYFDRFDPFNVRLLHTPLYEGKIKNYIGRAVAQHPDSLVAAVDYLLEGSKKDPDLYRYMLITLFNHFRGKQIHWDGRGLLPHCRIVLHTRMPPGAARNFSAH
jgi:hypothetical protein